MITVLIDFFDKKTKRHIEELKLDVPYDIVLAAAEADEFTGDELSEAMAEGKQIDYINCRPFDVTDDMKAYAIQHHPELKDKFDSYLHEFIGRHGLGPEYD